MLKLVLMWQNILEWPRNLLKRLNLSRKYYVKQAFQQLNELKNEFKDRN